jgi:hypothetical protein
LATAHGGRQITPQWSNGGGGGGDGGVAFKVFYFLTFTKQCSKILPNQFSTIFICNSYQIISYILPFSKLFQNPKYFSKFYQTCPMLPCSFQIDHIKHNNTT